MNHNCFTSTKEEDILEKDGDMLEKDDIIEELMVTSDEIRNASHLLQEIQRYAMHCIKAAIYLENECLLIIKTKQYVTYY